MSIKCGKCSKFQSPVYHATVADVAACHESDVPAPEVSRDHGPSSPQPSPSQDPRTGYSGKRVDLRELEDLVPAGRYAIDMSDDRLHFFTVDKPDTGKWRGYTFVKEQAGDDLHPVRSPQRREVILRDIGQNPGEAMLRYGLELGKCGHCGRTLTNEESRAVGIGPVCRSKMPRTFFDGV